MPTGVLRDDASSGQDLSFYDPNATMVWVELEAEQRGLSFPTATYGGQAWAAMEGSKFTQLYGRTTLTIEAVATLEGSPDYYARLVDVGDNSSWSSIQLASVVPGYLQLGFRDLESSSWPVPQFARVVIHFVLDTEADADARARLYVDGVKVEATTVMPPELNATIAQEDDPLEDYFTIGNAPAGDRAWIGIIHYVALYTTAMSGTRIAQHAAFLAERDDE
jgi:hypothetical protein